MTDIGYARVSTTGQDHTLQMDAFKAAGVKRVHKDTASGKNAERPGLARALKALQPGDVLVVWKLDRLGRRVLDVLNICEDLHNRGVGVRILTGRLAGTYQPNGEGKFFFTMMAAFAELERDIIIERTKAGLEAARAQGNVGGRKHKLNLSQREHARKLVAEGQSYADVARLFNVEKSTIYRIMKAA